MTGPGCLRKLHTHEAGPIWRTCERFVYFFLNPHLRIFLLILEREGGEGERSIDVREKQQSVAFPMLPDWEWNLQPRHVP